MLRLPVFVWTEVVTCADGARVVPGADRGDGLLWATAQRQFRLDVGPIVYQNLFWFYGHPVVYVMFFPFVGAVAEVRRGLLAASASSATARWSSRCWPSRRCR